MKNVIPAATRKNQSSSPKRIEEEIKEAHLVKKKGMGK
jgi:hypothetical protein